MGNEITHPTGTGAALSFKEEAAAKAKELTAFIIEQKLTTNIKGKEYVEVEGWQFAGLMFGVYHVIESCERVQGADGEFKYKASVALYENGTDRIVGRGIATCSNKESKKRSFEEYAIASMAQTRATGKAYRGKYSFIMKMAGYAVTPAEEMEGMEKEVDMEKVRDAELFIHTVGDYSDLMDKWGEMDEDVKREVYDQFNKKFKELKAEKDRKEKDRIDSEMAAK